MLFTLHKLALRLRRLRSAGLVLAVTGFIGVLMSLFMSPPLWPGMLESTVVLTLWGMMLYAFLQMFQTIPPPVLPHDGFFHKLVLRIKLGLYTLLAALVLLVTAALLWMSVRLLSVAI